MVRPVARSRRHRGVLVQPQWAQDFAAACPGACCLGVASPAGLTGLRDVEGKLAGPSKSCAPAPSAALASATCTRQTTHSGKQEWTQVLQLGLQDHAALPSAWHAPRCGLPRPTPCPKSGLGGQTAPAVMLYHRDGFLGSRKQQAQGAL